MEVEGVVHALRRIDAALVPDGSLVDIHPVPPAEQAEAAGRRLGRLDETEFLALVRATERELAAAGLFELAAEVEGDVVERFDTLEEFFEIVGEREGVRIPRELERRIRASRPPIDLRERVVFRRYGRLPGDSV
jgi:hypothetical protein